MRGAPVASRSSTSAAHETGATGALCHRGATLPLPVQYCCRCAASPGQRPAACTHLCRGQLGVHASAAPVLGQIHQNLPKRASPEPAQRRAGCFRLVARPPCCHSWCVPARHAPNKARSRSTLLIRDCLHRCRRGGCAPTARAAVDWRRFLAHSPSIQAEASCRACAGAGHVSLRYMRCRAAVLPAQRGACASDAPRSRAAAGGGTARERSGHPGSSGAAVRSGGAHAAAALVARGVIRSNDLIALHSCSILAHEITRACLLNQERARSYHLHSRSV